MNSRLLVMMAVSFLVSVGQTVWAMPGKVFSFTSGDQGAKIEGCTNYSGKWQGTCKYGDQTMTQESNILQFGCDVVMQDGHMIPTDGFSTQTLSAHFQGELVNFVNGTSGHWNEGKTILEAEYSASVWYKKDGKTAVASYPMKAEYRIDGNQLKVAVRASQPLPGFDGGECTYTKVEQ